MISKDFKINLKDKKITYKIKGSKNIYEVNALYSYLQNLFDEPRYMKYEVPIKAFSKKKYSLINGWTIDEKSLKHLKNGALTILKNPIIKS